MNDLLLHVLGSIEDRSRILLLNSAFIESLRQAQRSFSDNQDAVIVPSPKAFTSGVYLTPAYLHSAYEHLSDAPAYVKGVVDRILDYIYAEDNDAVHLDLTPFASPEDFLSYLVKLLPYSVGFGLGDKVRYWFGQLSKDGTLYAVFVYDRWKEAPLVVQAYLPELQELLCESAS